MRRLLPYTLAGAAIGLGWGIASRYLPGWLYLAITTAALVAVIAWALRSLREIRAMKRELENITEMIHERRENF